MPLSLGLSNIHLETLVLAQTVLTTVVIRATDFTVGDAFKSAAPVHVTSASPAADTRMLTRKCACHVLLRVLALLAERDLLGLQIKACNDHV